MPIEVILPKVDMDMTTGRISKWFVDEGAVVQKGDILFEIETDKAAMEIDAPASGVLRAVTGQAGIDIPVGASVAWIYEVGEEDNSANAKVSASELAATLAPSSPTPSAMIAAPATQSKMTGYADQIPRASPLARRRAREAGLDLFAIQGSGPHGRVTDKDVAAALTENTASLPPPTMQSMPSLASVPDDIRRLFVAGTYDEVPHDVMRVTIARRLTQSKQSIPHFYLSLSCEIDDLLTLRANLNAAAPVQQGQPAFKISVNDMIVKAMALALKAVPEANVSWTDTSMLRHYYADIAIAVSIPGGLITPIVRQACTKTLSQIANETKDLAYRARERKLSPDEYKGGTAAVSNLGMFGIEDFTAIVNPPHAMILAVGAAQKRPIVRGDTLGIGTMMSVTLSTDHRAVDGAVAAQFLSSFKFFIEKPLMMLV